MGLVVNPASLRPITQETYWGAWSCGHLPIKHQRGPDVEGATSRGFLAGEGGLRVHWHPFPPESKRMEPSASQNKESEGWRADQAPVAKSVQGKATDSSSPSQQTPSKTTSKTVRSGGTLAIVAKKIPQKPSVTTDSDYLENGKRKRRKRR